jgi:hypothetical protein
MKKLWIVKMILFSVASVVVMTAVMMWLWNWLVPELFSGPVITFWQSAGLLLLTRILFRGFAGMRGGRHRKWGDWKRKFQKMSPEEREKMRELWKKRCGNFDCSEEKPGENN